MRAVVEAAAAHVLRKLGEGVLQLVLGYGRHLLHVEGGEARRVGAKAARDGENLDVARRVPPAAELFAYLAGGEAEARLERVEYAALADAGVAREGADLAADALRELGDALAGYGAGLDELIWRRGVDIPQAARGRGVGLVDAYQQGAAGVLRRGRDSVDEEGVGDGLRLAGDGDKQVDIRDGRTDEEVAARQNPVHAAAALGVEGNLNPVAHKRALSVQAEAAPGAAFDGLIARTDIVEAAQGLDNDSLHAQSPKMKAPDLSSPVSGGVGSGVSAGPLLTQR